MLTTKKLKTLSASCALFTSIALGIGVFPYSDTRFLSASQLSRIRGGSTTDTSDGTQVNCDDATVKTGEVTARGCATVKAGTPCRECQFYGGSTTTDLPGGTGKNLTYGSTYTCSNTTYTEGTCDVDPTTGKKYCRPIDGMEGGCIGTITLWKKESVTVDP